jgi:hypothetical protein
MGNQLLFPDLMKIIGPLFFRLDRGSRQEALVRASHPDPGEDEEMNTV